VQDELGGAVLVLDLIDDPDAVAEGQEHVLQTIHDELGLVGDQQPEWTCSEVPGV